MSQECGKPDCLHCAIAFGAALCACGHNSFDHELGPCEECPCLGVRGEATDFGKGVDA